MTLETSIAQVAIKALIGALQKLKEKYSQRECERLISDAIRELLKPEPDLNVAKAYILKTEKLAPYPTPQLLRVKSLLAKAESPVWTKQEIELLKEGYSKGVLHRDIAKLLKRTLNAVESKATKLRVASKHRSAKKKRTIAVTKTSKSTVAKRSRFSRKRIAKR